MAGIYTGPDRADVIAQMWSTGGCNAGQNGPIAHKKTDPKINFDAIFYVKATINSEHYKESRFPAPKKRKAAALDGIDYKDESRFPACMVN